MYSLSFMDESLTQVLSQNNSKFTPVGIPVSEKQCLNQPMELFETRKKRLWKIIEEDFGENQAAFSRHVGIKASQVNRWLSDSAEKVPVINEVSARLIEQKCNKPRDWLDSDNPLPLLTPQALKLAEIISSLPAVQQEWIVNLVESALEMKRQSQGIDLSASTDDHQEK